MTHPWKLPALPVLLAPLWPAAAAEEKPVVGLVPKAGKPIKLDGKLEEWEGAFVTPVHVGHPDFANRGGQFLFLWDEQNLYVGLRCLDQHPAHVGPDTQIWNGDAVEFYLDTRRGDRLGAAAFGPGTLHCFYTPFTKREVKPRVQVRDLPAFKDFRLRGAEVAAAKTPWGYTAEFKLPWANFPGFAPKSGEVIGIDCELCSGDGGLRVDRTFVYSGPAAVGSPAAFGRVQLVDKVEAGASGLDGRQENPGRGLQALDRQLGVVRLAARRVHPRTRGDRQGGSCDYVEGREGAAWRSPGEKGAMTEKCRQASRASRH
jgi:hypothetical protein